MKTFLAAVGVFTSIIWGPLLMLWIVTVTLLALPWMLTKKALK